jgi:hypothetical protein
MLHQDQKSPPKRANPCKKRCEAQNFQIQIQLHLEVVGHEVDEGEGGGGGADLGPHIATRPKLHQTRARTHAEMARTPGKFQIYLEVVGHAVGEGEGGGGGADLGPHIASRSTVPEKSARTRGKMARTPSSNLQFKFKSTLR